jgi:hypothetical protein
LQPELHVVMPFVGSPVVAIDELGTDGTVWTWGTFLRSFSAGRRRRDGHLSRYLTVSQPKKRPLKWATNDENRHAHCVQCNVAMGLLGTLRVRWG